MPTLEPELLASLLYLAGMVPTLGLFLVCVARGVTVRKPRVNMLVTAIFWPVVAVWLTTATIKTWKEVYHD